MKTSLLLLALCCSGIAFSQDTRTQAQQYEQRKADNKVATERIHTQYTNNLPNAKSSTAGGSTSTASESAAIESWWKQLKSDYKNAGRAPAPGTTGGGFTDAQRAEFAATGDRREKELLYTSRVLERYHTPFNLWMPRIIGVNMPCTSGECTEGIGTAKNEQFERIAHYKDGKLNGTATFYLTDPMIKHINVTYEDNRLLGGGTVYYHDGSYENITFTYDHLSGEAALVFPNKEAVFFNRNNGKISGLLEYVYPDYSRVKILYRNDAPFSMFTANLPDYTYPSKGMYTGGYYLYIREGSLRKLFNDEGDGGFWAGEMKDGTDTPHGLGDKAWKDGDSYHGTVSNGVTTGTGTLYYASGAIYEGPIKRSSPEGKGTMHYSNGSYYEGEWKEGDWHGKGKLLYADGGSYEGSFKKGELSGKGKMQYVGGDQYDGEWKAGKRKGKGTYTRSDGFYRKGTFDDDGTNYVKFYNNKGEEITYEVYYPEG